MPVSPEHIIRFDSKDPYVNAMRREAVNIIEKYGYNYRYATQEDLDWIRENLKMSFDESDVKKLVKENVKELTGKYPYDVTFWIRSWLYAKYEKLRKDKIKNMQSDMDLFVTVVSPLPYYGEPFFAVIKFLDKRLRKVYNRKVRDLICEDPILVDAIEKGIPLPDEYLRHITYSRLRDQVMEKVDKKKGTPYAGSPTRSRTYFKDVYREAKKLGIDPNEHWISKESEISQRVDEALQEVYA